MAIKHKKIYVCDGCGTEYEDENQIRLFQGEVLSGNETKSYIRPGQMYCINCLQFALDYENKQPETVILKPEKNNDIATNENSSDNSETIRDILEKFKTLSDRISELENKTYHLNILRGGIREQYDYSIEKCDKMLQPSFDFNIESLKDDGEFLVLVQISDKVMENKFAVEYCKLQDINVLKEIIGNQSLFGVYFPSDKYIDVDSDDLITYFKCKTAKVVNKVFFGVPNIIDLEIYYNDNNGIGLIQKDKFNIHLEPIPKYEVSEQSTEKNIREVASKSTEEISSPRKYKDPIKDIDIVNKPKKKVTSLKVDDNYV